MRIVLASASPRRRELLGQIGLDFEVCVSDVEERADSVEPERVVEELSRQKAEAVLEELERQKAEAVLRELEQQEAEKSEWTRGAGRAEDVLVIGADTVVVLDGQILGKPSDAEDAVGMLRRLSGRTHKVYTGVTLLYRAGTESAAGRTRRKSFHEMTKVAFYPMTEGEISAYVSSGDCKDKAGAYGIQGVFARFVKGIEGDYNNVVGLPVGRLYQEAREWLER